MDFNTFYSMLMSSASITLGQNSIKPFNISGEVAQGSLLYASGDNSSEWLSVSDTINSIGLLDTVNNLIDDAVQDLEDQLEPRLESLEGNQVRRDDIVNLIDESSQELSDQILPRIDVAESNIVKRDDIVGIIEDEVLDATNQLSPRIDALESSVVPRDQIINEIDDAITDYASVNDSRVLTSEIRIVNRDDIVNEVDDAVKDVYDNLFPLINTPPIVATLPTSPSNGQIIVFQTSSMLTDGVAWLLRYNSSNSSSYKWECIGGAPWNKEVTTAETTTSTSYAALATAGPSVTVPLAGNYIIQYGSIQDYTVITSNRVARHSIDVGATGAVDVDSVATAHPNITGMLQTGMRNIRKTCAAGDAIVSKYKTGADTVRFQARHLSVIPINLG